MRLDFQRIAAAVPRGASVLDLGCAEGDMLAYLRAERAARGVGADIDRDGLIRCFERGVQAVYCDINKGLGMFYDNAFAVVALSQTLQSVRLPPQQLLREMLRIGDVAIVSFSQFWSLAATPAVAVGGHAGQSLAALPMARHPQCALLHH